MHDGLGVRVLVQCIRRALYTRGLVTEPRYQQINDAGKTYKVNSMMNGSAWQWATCKSQKPPSIQKDMCDPSGTLKEGQLVYTPDVGALHTVDKDCYAEINSDGASSPQVCVGVTVAQS